jgi:hypothetical protein
MSARQPRFKDFLTADQITERFCITDSEGVRKPSITPETVMGWRDLGLRSYRIGKRVWFYEPEVAQFILDHPAREER